MIQQEAWKLWLAVIAIAGGAGVWLYCELQMMRAGSSYKMFSWLYWQKRGGFMVIFGVIMLVLMSGCHASTRCYRLLWWRWC
jgi:uncharacterized membrane protein SpoIIM required for sporulation